METKTKSVLSLLLGIALYLCRPALLAENTTGAETLPCGPYSTSNWRSDDFKGTAFREWDGAGRTFSFDWKTETGDQIGRIGVSYGSSRLGVRMGDLRPDCVMSTDAAYTPAVDAWFYWTIYGWTHPGYTYWAGRWKGSTVPRER